MLRVIGLRLIFIYVLLARCCAIGAEVSSEPAIDSCVLNYTFGNIFLNARCRTVIITYCTTFVLNGKKHLLFLKPKCGFCNRFFKKNYERPLQNLNFAKCMGKWFNYNIFIVRKRFMQKCSLLCGQ